MRIQSNKAKGRLGQQEIRDMLLKWFPELSKADVRSTSMGCPGDDILLSTAAQKIMPWNIEVKRKKKIGAVRFMEQASEHGTGEPVAFFREDRGEWFASVSADYLMRLVKFHSLFLGDK